MNDKNQKPQQQTYGRNAVSATPYHTHNNSDSPRIPFLNLSDTPKSYSNSAGLPVLVNADENMLEFAALGVPGGGTGVTSFVPYEVVVGGTTATGPLRQVAGVGATGQFLGSNGASTLPTWKSLPQYPGAINADGTIVHLPSGWIVSSHPSAGLYTIEHDLASTNYVVVATIRSNGKTVIISDLSANTFDATCFNSTGTSTDSAWNFILMTY